MGAFDFLQDLGATLGGGETSEQEAIRKEREKLAGLSTDLYQNYLGNQYYGPTGESLRDIAILRGAIEQMERTTPAGSPAWSDIYSARDELKRKEEALAKSTSYTPDYMVPTTDYDVVGYTPTKADVASELLYATLNPGLYAAPQYASATMQAPSEAAKAMADKQGLSSQRAALRAIEDVYKQGGLTAIDRARLEDIRRQNQMQERASREAILADLERRGLSGSGTELAARLANQQGTADRLSSEGLTVAADAERRALEAMALSGTMGRDLATDIFNRQYQTGSAADEVNLTNTLGAREVEAATRSAQDKYSDWVRGVLQRDVDRRQSTNTSYADAVNAANEWLAGQQNVESRYGADASNTASTINTAAQTAANKYRADRAWDAIAGYNNQQAAMGGATLNKYNQLDLLSAQQPTTDPSQVLKNLWEGGKMVYGFAS
jgi:hypothetical protein